jgi:hypothetical protein
LSVLLLLLLLVKRSHAEFLVGKGLVLAARGTVAIVCVISEWRILFTVSLQVNLSSGLECTDDSEESFILLNDKHLVAAATKSGDSFAEVLG